MTTEVISAWDVYWVLQLDSIGCVVGFAAAGVVAAGAFSIVAAWFQTDMRKIYEDSSYTEGREKHARYDASVKSWAKLARRLLPVGAALCLFAALLPSSKTAAAMIVLPAIANNETVQTEAADLYKLAKKALADAVGDDEQEKK